MSADEVKDRTHEAIIEQASAWFIRHRAGELSAADKEAYLQWLRASPLNLREYLEQVRLHQDFAGVLPALELDRAELWRRTRKELDANVLPLSIETMPDPQLSPRRKFAVRRPRVAVLTATVLLTAGVAWLIAGALRGERISVPHGEQRTVQLPDGTAMLVNVSSQVRVKYSKRERLIVLERGQALFEVARDVVRPFRVRAGTTEVVAVGTRFDVYRRENQDVVVTVVEGKVKVREPAVGSATPVPLSAGEQLRVGPASTTSRPKRIDVHVATAWTRREMIFKGEPLAEVAAEFNRYIAEPVRIEDENLKKMRVRAVFNPYDSESFLAFLRQYDVEVRTGPAGIEVRPREPAN